ncbi:translation elongation factor-like protein [Candidatus Woesearchaeota archaeon]|nr:translation elongation factor-like protein [Candidatus Woesearchaeota archaeon]
MAEKKLVGKVTHFFPKINVAVIDVQAPLKVGDKISIEGPTTNFTQKIDSMEVEHKKVEKAKKGDDIGMKVKERVREKDMVYKVE